MDQKQINYLKQQAGKQIKEFRERLMETRNSNAEYQRRNAMSKEERMGDAIERLAKGRKVFNDWKAGGKDTSMEQARKDIDHVVKKTLRDRGIE